MDPKDVTTLELEKGILGVISVCDWVRQGAKFLDVKSKGEESLGKTTSSLKHTYPCELSNRAKE